MLARYHAAHLPRENARSFSYRIIKIQILNMQLLPGEKLSEAEMAQQLGVSRTPVHDTFARLAREKMLEIEPQRGTFIPRLHSDRILQAARIGLKLSLAVLETLYVQRHSPEELQPLARCAEQEKEALPRAASAAMEQLRTEFFRELFRLAGYMPVFQTMYRISADLTRMLQLVDDMTVWNRLVRQHEAIVQALRQRDSDAACARMTECFSLAVSLLAGLKERYPQYFI